MVHVHVTNRQRHVFVSRLVHEANQCNLKKIQLLSQESHQKQSLPSSNVSSSTTSSVTMVTGRFHEETIQKSASHFSIRGHAISFTPKHCRKYRAIIVFSIFPLNLSSTHGLWRWYVTSYDNEESKWLGTVQVWQSDNLSIIRWCFEMRVACMHWSSSA